MGILLFQRPCECQRQRKRCYCFRPHRNENWLFSRYSTGWKCGLHADWTELTSCVDVELDKNEGETAKRRYFYISLLREPISRYMSEYRHVRRGATWKGSRHWCLGRQATANELPPCYKGKDWLDVDLDQFAGCESNLAANRQTRMLADLALVGCYNKSSMPAHERDRVMLASAKRNLAAMAYFGLTEYQKVKSQVNGLNFNILMLYLHCRCPNTYSRRPSICALPYPSSSTMQQSQLLQSLICVPINGDASRSSIAWTLSSTHLPRICCFNGKCDGSLI